MNEIQLTETENLIYQELMESIRKKDKQKVSLIAKKVGVANSSISKVAKKLGYSGWNEMYYSLVNNHTDLIPLSFNDFKFIDISIMHEQLNLLCDLIIQNKQNGIVIQTIGDVQHLDEYLLENFWKRGFTAYKYRNELVKNLKEHERSGVSFFISESGIVFTDNCIYARENDFSVVSISANQNSPQAANAHISIEIKNNKSNLLQYEPNFFTTKVLIFLELLFVQIDEKMNR